MKASQIAHGKEKLRQVADAWGVSVDQAASILLGCKEVTHFFQWVNAWQFLEEELWKEE